MESKTDKSDDGDNMETVNHVIVVEDDVFLEYEDDTSGNGNTKSEISNELVIKSNEIIIPDRNSQDLDVCSENIEENNLDCDLSNEIITKEAKAPTTYNHTDNNKSAVSKYVCNACQESFESKSLCMLHVSGGECGAKLKHAFKAGLLY